MSGKSSSSSVFCTTTTTTKSSSSPSHHKKMTTTTGVSQQTATTTTTTTTSTPSPNHNKSTATNRRSQSKSCLHVGFHTENKEDMSERKKKYLTAKYGQHQMSLIKKRLKVEMWMYDQLQTLYDNNGIEIDLDELLDLEDSDQRKEWLKIKLMETKKPRPEVEHFIQELLEKANIL